MIRFRLLGGLSLRSTDGRDLDSVVVGPKRLALLAYLSLATPRGFHRRDTLLALLWPEFDAARARKGLRNALHILRRAVGADVIVSRGSEEIGLDRERFWCDAVAFEEALARGDPAAALEVYRGDLLEGFFVSEAPEFEQWVDRERRRLKEEARSAAASLSEREVAAGALEKGLRWANRARELDPDDESALRRVMLIEEQLGDRTAALRSYQEFARHVEEEYGTGPAPQTQSLAERLRTPVPRREPRQHPAAGDAPRESPTRNPERLPARPPAPARSEPPARARLERQPERGGPRTARPRSWPRWSIFLIAAGIVGIFGGAWMLNRGSASPAQPLVPHRVVVLPFTVRVEGGAEVTPLGASLASLLSTRLDGAGEMRSVDPEAVATVLRHSGGDVEGPERGAALAQRFRAGRFVVGEIVQVGEELNVRATLYDRSRGPNAAAQVWVEGRTDRLFDIADELTVQLLLAELGSPGGGLGRVAARTTSSLAALKAYLQGERELRAGRVRTAVAAFERAVAEDSAFALANYRLSNAAVWDMRYDLAGAAAERALRHVDSLPERERRLIEAYVAGWRGDLWGAERSYRRILAAQPEYAEAWKELGEVLYHYNTLRGRSKTEAREPFRRALELDVRDKESLFHLLELAAWQADRAAFDSLFARLDFEERSSLRWRTLRAFAFGPHAEREDVLAAVAAAGDKELYRTVVELALHSRRVDAARELARMQVRSASAPDWRALGRLHLARLELASGRWRAAQSELSAAALTDPASALEHRALYANLPWMPASTLALDSLRVQLEQWNATAAQPHVNRILAVHDDLHEELRSYLLGLTEARVGRHSAALGRAATLEAAATDVEAPLDLASDLAHSVRAQVARARVAPREALAELEAARAARPTWLINRSTFYAQTYERYARAIVLEELGRDEEALRWYAAVGEDPGHGLVFRAPSHLRRARIHERRGEREQAVEQYARFVELWSGCDAELRPAVLEAQQRLAALDRSTPR